MKMNKSMFMFLAGFLLAVSFASAVSAQAIIKTIPEKNVWIADGVTEYRLDVWADNTGLGGQVTDGVQWRVLVPDELQPFVTITRAEKRPENDFFVGSNMIFEIVNMVIEGLQVRLANPGEGHANEVGILATYYFMVDPGFTGMTSFDLGSIQFASDSGQAQLFFIENTQFTVIDKPEPPRIKELSSGNVKSLDISCWFGGC